MLPHQLPTQRVPVQHMHTPIIINHLRLLVHQPASLGNPKRYDSLSPLVGHCLLPSPGQPPHIRDDAPGPVPPRVALVVRVRIAYIVVVLGAVRPGLLLVLDVARVVPPSVPDEPPPHPRDVQPARPAVPAVHVRVAFRACERRPDELPAARARVSRRHRRRAVQVQVVGAQAGLAVAQGQEQNVWAERAEPRVRDVAEVLVGAG